VLVPRPTSSTMPAEPLKDTDLLHWGTAVIEQVFGP